MPDVQDRPVEAPEPYRRTPEEMLWGWQENGKRTPGIIERIETATAEICAVKFQLTTVLTNMKGLNKYKWIVVGSIWLDIIIGHRGTIGDQIMNTLLHSILPALSASAAPLIH